MLALTYMPYNLYLAIQKSELARLGSILALLCLPHRSLLFMNLFIAFRRPWDLLFNTKLSKYTLVERRLWFSASVKFMILPL